MGCTQSHEVTESGSDAEVVEAKRRNDEIERQLQVDRLTAQKTVKLLALEAENSGKTEILQQMQMAHRGSYSEQERSQYKKLILSHVVKAMRSFLDILKELDMSLSRRNERCREIILSYYDAPDDEDLSDADFAPRSLLHALRCVRHDPVVELLMQRQSELADDSIPFYINFIDRLVRPGFVPTDQDIISVQSRNPPLETTFDVGELTYRVIDFSAQRSDRRKWIHCFEDVEAVLFFAALSEYDQLLPEQGTTNRLQEAMAIFDSICNSRWFTHTSLVLLLTKSDIFAEKLLSTPLENYFPDYTGGRDSAAACDYILKRFLSLNRRPKEIYAHYTTEKNTHQVKLVVLNAVQDTVSLQNGRPSISYTSQRYS